MQRNNRPVPPGIANGHQHAEAFCLMTYATDDRTLVEVIWNSRDGVTPFGVRSVDGREMTHIDWHRDNYAPDFIPQPGQRVFGDLTRARAERLATERAELWWDHPDYPMSRMFDTKAEAAASLSAEYYGEGNHPAVYVVGPDGTWGE